MEKKNIKHLIVTLGGCGLATPGMMLFTWVLSNVDLARVNQYGFGHEIGLKGLWPFLIIAVLIFSSGVLCIVFAMLCESGRYDKK